VKNKIFLNNKYFNILFFLFLIFCFFLPTHSSLLLSGVPITNKYSTIISIIFIFFICLNYYILRNVVIKLLITSLLLLKIFLIYLPVTGIELNQYFSEDDLDKNNFIRTYDSFWNHKYSFILNRNLEDKKNFPIDWTVHSNVNFKDENTRYFKSYDEYLNLSLIYNIAFYLYLPKDTIFRIEANGNDKTSLSYNSITNFNTDNFETNKDYELKKGTYKFQGSISYFNSKWSLKFLIKLNDKYISAFNDNYIFQTMNDINNINFKYKLLNLLSKILDLNCLLLILVTLFIYFRNTFSNGNFFYKFSLFIIPFVIFFLLKDYTNKFDFYGSFPVSIAFILSGAYIFYYKNKFIINDSNIGKYFFIIVFPLLCIFFLLKFFPEVEQVSWWDYGDDWTAFQTFARSIVVDEEWLNAGEGVIYFRPGIRYVFAIIHIIFGFSGFAQKIIEPLLIFSGCLFFLFILNKFKINSLLALLSSILLISIFLGENYRWNISRGITEYYSFFLILLNCFLIIKLDISKISNFFIIALIGILNVWLREDHITLIFLAIYLSMHNNQIYNNEKFINSIYNFTIRNFLIIFCYGLVLSFGLALLWIRNLYVGGNFGLDHPYLSITSGAHTRAYGLNIFSNLYMLLTATIWPNLPRITTFFLLGGTLLAFMRFLNIKKFMCIHPSILMVIAGCIFPAFIAPLIGYYPRYTIKYLPFCILIFSIIINDNYIYLSKTKSKKS
tara:strand:+ start:6283 stop:8457 length:2175 start_codon:yes stop_codon:yes gene_type:complete